MPGCFIPPEEGCSIGYDEIDQCCPSKSVCRKIFPNFFLLKRNFK